jgi:hypothetical protein
MAEENHENWEIGVQHGHMAEDVAMNINRSLKRRGFSGTAKIGMRNRVLFEGPIGSAIYAHATVDGIDFLNRLSNVAFLNPV